MACASALDVVRERAMVLGSVVLKVLMMTGWYSPTGADAVRWCSDCGRLILTAWSLFALSLSLVDVGSVESRRKSVGVDRWSRMNWVCMNTQDIRRCLCGSGS